MHISDWSSDVCSSDLCQLRGLCPNVLAFALDSLDRRLGRSNCFFGAVFVLKNRRMLVVRGIELVKAGKFGVSQRSRLGWKSNEAFDEIVTGIGVKRRPYPRSEEHTSELRSLMRSSYAVFCLKKNTT